MRKTAPQSFKRPRSNVRGPRQAVKAQPARPAPAIEEKGEAEANTREKASRSTRRFLRNVRKKRFRTGQKSGLKQTVEAELTARAIDFKSQYPIGRCHADLYFQQTNTVVELHGCYWHGHSVCQEKPKKRRRYLDARRYTFFRNKGYKLVIVWECEVKKDLEAVMKKLTAAAGVE